MTKREKAFLSGLRELTMRTGVVIEGCGCCGSPAIRDISKSDLASESGYGVGDSAEVKWISPNDKESWDRYKASIVY
jgi:hypothetical protein